MNGIKKLAGAAVVSGIASVALAAPAMAVELPDPVSHGPAVQIESEALAAADDGPWLEVGLGVLTGIALAGAGVAAATGVRHRRHPVPQG